MRRALYAGDDATDLDAFHVLGELELGVRVGVASPESPRGISELADVVGRASCRAAANGRRDALSARRYFFSFSICFHVRVFSN